jgi:hypothetical protein
MDKFTSFRRSFEFTEVCITVQTLKEILIGLAIGKNKEKKYIKFRYAVKLVLAALGGPLLLFKTVPLKTEEDEKNQ